MEKINDTAERIRQCNTRQAAGRSEWIAATLEKAQLFAAERARMPDNRTFAVWLAENEIEESANDRAAYIEIGENVDAWRTIIECCDSVSVQMIVRDHRASAARLISLCSVTKNDASPPAIVETPEIAPETSVSAETTAENSETNSMTKGFKLHAGLTKVFGVERAAVLCGYFTTPDRKVLTMFYSISQQRGGKKEVDRLIDRILTGEYGTSNSANCTPNYEFKTRIFAPGAPYGWMPAKLSPKATPASLREWVDAMPRLKVVTDAFAAAPSKPGNQGAFCDHQWELLRRAKNAEPAGEPAAEPTTPPAAEPTVSPVEAPATKEADNVVSIGDTRRIICLGTQLWPIPDAAIYGLEHLSYEDARAAYDIIHEMVTILRAPAVLDAESIGRKIRHMTSHIRAIANGGNVADLMSKGTYAMKGDVEVHLLKDAAPPVVKFA